MNLGSGIEASLIVDVVFWVIAVSTIIAALAVIHLKDLFRAALFLVVTFLGVAGLFVLLMAEFLAVVQVIIYVGAISVLIIFAVLMTRNVDQGNPSNSFKIPAILISVAFIVISSFVIMNTDWNILDNVVLVTNEEQIGSSDEILLMNETKNQIEKIFSNTVPEISGLLLRDFVLAFELASVLLLAAIVGALVLVRER